MHKISSQTVEKLSAFRRELHRFPELSGEEQTTAGSISEMLKTCDPDQIIERIGGEGVAAVFKGDGKGPAVMIRCELDALPIPEDDRLPYASERSGISHKCGHDGHMAIVAGVAGYLGNHPPACGRVILLFQPAEETGEGAEAVLKDDKFKALYPDFIFALHNLPGYPLHRIVTRKGIFAAASRGMLVKIQGETSHASQPELGRSPAPVLAQLIQVLSSFPQYFSALDEAAKVTVIQSRLGDIAFGTSPGYAELRATFRTYKNDLMEKLCLKAEKVMADTIGAHGLKHTLEWTEIFQPTVNGEASIEIVEKAASRAGLELSSPDIPFAWSEDFGRFTSRFQGAMFGVGAGKDHPPLHSSEYDFPDALLDTGTRMFIEIIDQITGLE